MSKTAELAVIGLGAVGSATLYQAAKASERVIGIDRFDPPHDRGSSHGDTRITRQAIGEGREFVPLVLRSNEIWRELEAVTGRLLMTLHGGLVLASANVPGDHHGSRSFIQDTIRTAEAFRIAHEKLSTAELQSRYPQFCLQGDEIGYFEAGAGFLYPEACVGAQLAEARRLGAEIRTSETVLEIKTVAGAVEVRTDKATYLTSKAIVTVGPWIQTLLGAEYARLFKVYRQVMNWFALARNPERYMPERFPIFIWLTGRERRDMLYGFPAIGGPQQGVKISTEQYEATVDPDRVERSVSRSETTATYSDYIGPRFPDVSSACLRSEVCLYTVTPDAKFIVDQVGNSEQVLFASACSGHGFKHSAALGEALAMKALGRQPVVDLSPFRLSRFAGQKTDYLGGAPGGSVG
jgi:sarcosine oxidase